MPARDPINAFVAGWLERRAKGLSAEQCAVLLGNAALSVCRRAHATLGDVTVLAVAERVGATAAERFVFLDGVALWSEGERRGWEDAAARAAALDRSEVLAAARHVLVGLLTVIDRLTAGILTPALRAELDKVATPSAPKRGKRKQADR